MERTPNTTIASLIAAAGLGALAMFLLDPQSGSRRVALARDRARHLMHEAADAAGTGWRDLRHRASGVAAGARHLVRREQVSDRVLEERVRAELGRWVSHPHAVTVTARDGRIVRSGRRPPWPRGKRHAPATQLLGVSAGAALVAGGALQRGLPGLLLMAAGAAIATDVARARHRGRDAADAETAPHQPNGAMQASGTRMAPRRAQSGQRASV
jgi:hypothetical protein